MRRQIIPALWAALLLLGFAACEPETDTKPSLGNLPTASIQAVPSAENPNIILLSAVSDDAFFFSWDLGNGNDAEGPSIEAYYPFAGTYTIKLTALGRGGYVELEQSVVITDNDANACTGNLEKLTACGTKTWRLDPNPGALHVGPNISETWWANQAADVAARSCLFNDEYIFRSDGTFTLDLKGDFWADTDGNGNLTPADLGVPVGCNPSSGLPANYAAWGGGNFTFNVTDNNLTVTGQGAFLGLYKVGTASEVTTPQSSVTLSISELTDDRMVLFADYGGLVWRFTFVSN